MDVSPLNAGLACLHYATLQGSRFRSFQCMVYKEHPSTQVSTSVHRKNLNLQSPWCSQGGMFQRLAVFKG
jgi:hypothetical protein